MDKETSKRRIEQSYAPFPRISAEVRCGNSIMSISRVILGSAMEHMSLSATQPQIKYRRVPLPRSRCPETRSPTGRAGRAGLESRKGGKEPIDVLLSMELPGPSPSALQPLLGSLIGRRDRYIQPSFTSHGGNQEGEPDGQTRLATKKPERF
jgi:hypothetical protein